MKLNRESAHSPRVVLVTAGASGIGLAIAEGFRAAGDHVVVTDVREEALIEARTLGLEAHESNAAEEHDVRSLFETISRAHGRLDVLVNNAGIAGPTGALDVLDSREWQQTLDVNVMSQFLASKYAIPLLRRSKAPAIINISSAAGRLGMRGRSAYSASKWAVVGLTKTLAIELGEDGITVNAICPGAVDGPRIRAVMDAKAQQLGVHVDEIASQYERQSSLNRMIDVTDVANAAVFLAGPGSRSITGQVLPVDGNTEKLF